MRASVICHRLLKLLAASCLLNSLAAKGEDFPLPHNIALTPDEESLGNRPNPTPFIVSNSTSGTADTHNPDERSRDQCARAPDSPYNKSVVVTSFPRRETDSAKAGYLHHAEEVLPQLLSQRLQQRHAITSPVQLQQGLAQPNASTNQRLAAQVQQLAQTHRTQFVLSGEILDMSMAHPRATYAPGLYTRFINGVHDTLHINTPLDKRDRHFSFNLNLRDGFTGQVLFQKRYDTYGVWGVRNPRAVGFGSPRFWESDYGEQVSGLVAKATDELAAAIRCQPYIARVETRPGQQHILLHSGANNGLRAGDRLSLYQLVRLPISGEYQLYDTRLIDRQISIELREVYPSHSVAMVNSDSLLNGHYLAIAP
jgi:hypothetical protein